MRRVSIQELLAEHERELQTRMLHIAVSTLALCALVFFVNTE